MVVNKRMKMPKRCADCPNEAFADCYICCETDEIIDKNERLKKRLDNCPLVEIVTCKDCKHRIEASCLKHGIFAYDSFYCKDGEKNTSQKGRNKLCYL